jgi:hypothetical protein
MAEQATDRVWAWARRLGESVGQANVRMRNGRSALAGFAHRKPPGPNNRNHAGSAMALGIVLKHIAMIFLYQVVLVILLYIGGASAENPYVEPVFVASLILFMMNSVFINRGLFRGISNTALRYVMLVAFSGILALVYCFITIVVTVNAHLAMGGSL